MLKLRGLKVRAANYVASRAAHTRSKKVDVQLLKDTYGRRYKGEVFQVSEGHMRLKLHPEGIAAYVLKNQPTPIPVLPAAKAQQLRREAQLEAKAAEVKAREEERQAAQPTEAEASQQKVQSIIDALDFPVANQQAQGSESSASATPQAASSGEPEASTPGETANTNSGSGKKKFSWQSDFVANITDKQ